MADGPERLQRRLARGEPEAYRLAYEAYGASLYRAAVRILSSSADAEDAVQDVFVALVRGRGRLEAVRDLRAYLFMCLRHAAGRLGERDRRRRQVSLESTNEPVAEPATVTPASWLPGLGATGDGGPGEYDDPRLARAIARLAEEQRTVLAMKIDGGLTFGQIGAVLGISPNTAASRYRYALAKLRGLLGVERPRSDSPGRADAPRGDAPGKAGVPRNDTPHRAGGKP